MSKLQIKAELLPKRCEICHQIDCFDPFLNFCSRCNELIEKRLTKNKFIKKIIFTDRPLLKIFIWPLGGIAVGVVLVIGVALLGLIISLFSPSQEEINVCSDGSTFAFAIIFGLILATLFFGAILGSFAGIIYWVTKFINSFIKKHN